MIVMSLTKIHWSVCLPVTPKKSRHWQVKFWKYKSHIFSLCHSLYFWRRNFLDFLSQFPTWCTKFFIYLYTIYLLKSSTYFEQYAAHLQEVYVVTVSKFRDYVSEINRSSSPPCSRTSASIFRRFITLRTDCTELRYGDIINYRLQNSSG